MFANDVVLFENSDEDMIEMLKIYKILTKKSRYMLFSRTGKVQSSSFSISLNNVEIKRIRHFKYLGIFLDESLSFKEHIKILSLKISKTLGFFHGSAIIFLIIF